MDTILSLIYFFRVVVVSPAFGVDTNQKKKHGYHGLYTDWSFTDFFFLYYMANDSWIWLWIYLDSRVLTHSLSWRYQMTNKRAKCLLINQQTVLHIARRTPKGINHSNLHASSTVMTFKSFSSKSFTFLVTR